MIDYKGAIHIHTKLSDGTGDLSQIVKAGLKTKLDFLIISDHNHLQYKEEGREGWYEDRLLVLVGEEVSHSNEHILALGIQTPLPEHLSPAESLKKISEQNGLSFLVHPYGKYRVFLRSRDYSWKNWQENNFSGIEIWSYMFDWIAKVKLYNLPYYFLFPEKAINGPFYQTLRKWDELTQERPVVGIAGVDAHARGFWPIQVFPYAKLFRTVLTHVLLPEPFEKSFSKDAQRIYAALQQGHCYFAYEKIKSATGFKFTIQGTQQTAIMGDWITFDPSLQLIVTLPHKAQLRILHNGMPLLAAYSDGATISVRKPGVYRVDSYLQGKPWIFSNPIYVMPDENDSS